MTEAKFNILKQKVQDPHDWDAALHYFLDHFSNDGQLFKRSQKVHIPLIQQLFGELCVGLFRKSPVPLIGLSVFRVKEFGLIHGSCMAEGKHILCIYLTDIHQGVFGISYLLGQRLEHAPACRHCRRQIWKTWNCTGTSWMVGRIKSQLFFIS